MKFIKNPRRANRAAVRANQPPQGGIEPRSEAVRTKFARSSHETRSQTTVQNIHCRNTKNYIKKLYRDITFYHFFLEIISLRSSGWAARCSKQRQQATNRARIRGTYYIITREKLNDYDNVFYQIINANLYMNCVYILPVPIHVF